MNGSAYRLHLHFLTVGDNPDKVHPPIMVEWLPRIGEVVRWEMHPDAAKIEGLVVDIHHRYTVGKLPEVYVFVDERIRGDESYTFGRARRREWMLS